MKLSTTKIEQRRSYFFVGNDLKQTAEIIFEFVNDTGLKNDGVWNFSKCNFYATGAFFKLEDWEFLAAVYEKIKELNKMLNK